MVKTQVVSFQLYVASRCVSLQLIKQHCKISAIDGTDGCTPFLFINTLQFYYKLKFWTCKEVLLQ